MGACVFKSIGAGKTADDAFNQITEHARYQYGHGGYTGSIAEKDSFVVVARPMTKTDAVKEANRLIDEEDSRIDDKWGPAGAIEIVDESNAPTGKWLFFGWASE
jgi:hypothetical protein